MKTWKKVTAVALAVCLLVSGMTMSASAAEATKVSGDFLAGANLNLNEGIAIQFLATTTALSGYTDTYLSVEYLDRDATAHTKIIEPVAYGDYMNYKFDAVSPDRMADDITATLYGTKNGTEYQLGDAVTYSVKTYVANIYTRTTQVVKIGDTYDDTYLDDLSLQTLLADILYYGEMSRLYTGVDTESPLADWVASTKTATPATPYASDASSSVKKLAYSDGVTSSTEHISWSSVGLNLRENPAILYKFKLTNKASGVSNYKLVVEIEGEDNFEYQLSAADYDKTERCYVYRFRGLDPTKMGEKVSAYFVDGSGNKVSAVLDYSVESFAYYCYTETNGGTVASDTVTKELYNLTQATLSYGTSAKSYFGKRVLPFSKGINVNGLESFSTDSWDKVPGSISMFTSASTYQNIASQGFDYVRICANLWRAYLDDNDDYSTEEFMGFVDTAIKHALDNNLYVMLSFHGWFDIGDEENDIDECLYIWDKVAERYKDYDQKLMFEPLNEPWYVDGKARPYLSDSKLNELQASIISTIRSKGSNNAERLIICCTADGNKAWKLSQLVLPDDDNLAVAIHEYSPYNFTHQNFEWAGLSGQTTNLEDEGGFASATGYDFSEIKKFTAKTGIPVVLNEFGVNLVKATPADVNTYLTGITKFCRENRIAWAYWQYEGSYSSEGSMSLYRNMNSYSVNKTWDEAALNALFPARAAAQ